MESLSYPHLLRSLTLKYFLLNLFLFPFSALLPLLLSPAALFLLFFFFSYSAFSFSYLSVSLTYILPTTRTYYSYLVPGLTGLTLRERECVCIVTWCVFLCTAISTDGPLSCSEIMDRWKHPNFPRTTATLPPPHTLPILKYIYTKKN